MAKRKENPSKEIKQGEEEKEKEEEAEAEAEEEKSFEELGLDPRLTRALMKKGILKPTPIQRVAIPLILVSLSKFNVLRLISEENKIKNKIKLVA